MAEALVVDQAAHEDAAGAVGFGELDLGDHARRIDHRHHGNPLKPAFAPGTDIDQPLVVTAADRVLDFGSCRQRPEKQRRIQHLNVDIELVHVL
jgi:hypothetical protein